MLTTTQRSRYCALNLLDRIYLVQGFMLDFKDFSNYMASKTGTEYVRDYLQPRLKDIVRSSLSCACDSVDHRKNSWELYGFDFMIDDRLEPWLIEINSSPACDYSTKVTEVYVQKALTEILNVVLDLRDWEKADKETRGAKPDIGGWLCIHRGPLLDVPTSSFGSNFEVKGQGLRCPPKKLIMAKSNHGEKEPIDYVIAKPEEGTNTNRLSSTAPSTKESMPPTATDVSKAAQIKQLIKPSAKRLKAVSTSTDLNDSDSSSDDIPTGAVRREEPSWRWQRQPKRTSVGMPTASIPLKLFSMELTQ